MQKGDIVELTIESVGMDGEGVAKHENVVVFVPFTLVGEVAKCQITLLKKKFAKAKVIKLLQASPLRSQPLCPYFRKCGGCDMQHIVYERQLEIKKENIENCFKKYSSEQVVVNDIVPSTQKYYYRNKAQFPLFTQNGKVSLGFFKENSHDFVLIEKCYLMGEWCQKFTDAFLKVANKLKLSTYNEKAHNGLLRHLVLRKVNEKVSVTIVVNANSFKFSQSFVEEFNKIGIPYSLYISYNTRHTNLIMYNAKNVFGEEDITTQINGIKVGVNPMSFMQINDEIRDKIYDKVGEIVKTSQSEVVIDAYSGVGVLTNIIAKNASKVYGVEIVPEAVKNADNLAKINSNQNKITNVCGDSAIEVPRILNDLQQDFALSFKNTTQMRLNNIAFAKIKDGKKRFEIRLNDAKRQALKQDDFIVFQNVETKELLVAKVKSISKFETFHQMFMQIDNTLLGCDNNDFCEQNAGQMYDYYTLEQEQEHGVLAIEIQPLFLNSTVVLDPPRKGCDELVLQAILKAMPSQIVYVSCNPATLARDYAILKDKYKIECIQPYDMFPQTSHVETVVCLTRRFDN